MINKRILKNTLMLYIRQILIVFVTLYSVRVVLDILGVVDFGVYNLVAGIVMLCSFLSASMSSATQRYFSYALGKNDRKLLKKTFTINASIYVSIAIVSILLLETIGLFLLEKYLNIPIDRKDSALIVYHYTVFGFAFSIMSAPLIAIIIAHEDMRVYAFVSMFEAIMKLSVAIILIYIGFDKLESYGFLLMLVSIINSVIYIIICFKKYPECQLKNNMWDWVLFRDIVSFTGWTLFGQFTSVVRNQAVTIMLNQFFNPAVVASRAIAVSVSTQVNMFANNFNTGLYPPIVKNYASNNKFELHSLIYSGSKLTFFLMWFFTLPLLIEMKSVLTLWLKVPPVQAVIFTKLALIEALVLSISLPLTTAARAPGKMRDYELVLGLMQVMILVVSYVFLKLNYEAYIVFVIAIVINIIMFWIRLEIVSRLIELSRKLFIMNVVIPVFIIASASSFISFWISQLLHGSLIGAITSMVISMLVSCCLMYFFGLDSSLRTKIKAMIVGKICKLGCKI